MPEQEIIDKLTGLVVFDQLRIEGLQGEGKENVVLRATKLDDNAQLVLKLYQSNPMFLLNEVDFDFLPKSQDSEQDEERHLEILEKLLMACESENVGLFFWHMRSIYGRILMCLIDDYKQYQMVVMDTTTSVFQNSELLQVGVESLNRLKHGNRIMDCEEWEYGLRADNVEAVVNFLKPEMFSEVLTFDKPVPLLALVFSEGFFGMIPSNLNNS